MLQEIFDAFKQNQGFSLLIKGAAGTGKSTIALEVLSQKENPLYISTRVSPKSLYGQFPWIENVLPPTSILDATNILLPQTENIAVEMQRMIAFQGIPKFIEAIYHRVNEKKDVTCVIDSWDAVVKSVPDAENEDKYITQMTELIRRINVNLVLVTEHNEPTFLDYLVDGIVHLDDEDYANRRLRVMTITKMRGINIKNKRYVYSLDGGHMKVFSPFDAASESIASLGEFQPITVDDSTLISSGNAALDAITKIPKGSTVNVEIKKYCGLPSLVLPINMLLQNGIVSMQDLFPEKITMINHDSCLKPFFEKGFVSLKAADDSITINIFKSGAERNETLVASPDYHLVLDAVEGVIICYGEIPYTKLFAVEITFAEGLPSFGLVPIV
jgi:KaiC/GvpD/RAD55 family RecA-like ATPase